MRVIFLLALCLGASASACPRGSGSGPSNPELATLLQLQDLPVGIGRFAAAHGRLPDALEDVCASDLAFPCRSYRTDGEFLDGWSTPLRYARSGEEYELRSAGADRQMQTADDLVLSSARARAQVSAVAGCYRMPMPPQPGYVSAFQVKLDTVAEAPGAYRMHMAPRHFGLWFPMGNVIMLEIAAGSHRSAIVLRPEGDSLVGYEGARREPRTLTRTACGAELAGGDPTAYAP